MRPLCLKSTPQISPPTRWEIHLLKLEGIAEEPMDSAGEHPKEVIPQSILGHAYSDWYLLTMMVKLPLSN